MNSLLLILLNFLLDLIQGREYEFRAMSANSAGRSSFSQPRTVQLSSGENHARYTHTHTHTHLSDKTID